jgi:outer membrane protein
MTVSRTRSNLFQQNKIVRPTKALLNPLIMRTLLKALYLLLLSKFLLSGIDVRAQSQLEKYVDEGLANNLVVQQKAIDLEKALVTLQIAKGMFMPSISVQGSYTSGNGGRSISLPVGDLLNPVYATLNQLTDSKNFSQIENVKQNFFPKNFYDARIHTSIPILNTDLTFNHKIRQQQILLQKFEVQIYKRELVRNIKVAYFHYLSSMESVKIFESALERAEEGKRVNTALLSNGRGLQAYVLRAESDVQNISSQIIEADKQAHNAQLYFNFLLNRESDELIMGDGEVRKQLNTIANDLIERSFGSREELRQLQQAVLLNQTAKKMSQSFWIPKISGFVDIGSQSQNWVYNNQSRYYLVGLQLDIPLFSGFTNQNKIRLAQLEVKNSNINYSASTRQIEMNVQVAKNGLITAYSDYHSAEKQFDAAQSYQRLIDKGYKEGVNTFIETVDARSQLTSAQFKTIINQYRVLIAAANYERETASFPLHH